MKWVGPAPTGGCNGQETGDGIDPRHVFEDRLGNEAAEDRCGSSAQSSPQESRSAAEIRPGEHSWNVVTDRQAARDAAADAERSRRSRAELSRRERSARTDVPTGRIRS